MCHLTAKPRGKLIDSENEIVILNSVIKSLSQNALWIINYSISMSHQRITATGMLWFQIYPFIDTNIKRLCETFNNAGAADDLAPRVRINRF